MLRLFIDRGNTALKWQLCQQAKVLAEGSATNDVSLDDALGEVAARPLIGVYVASVASGDFESALKAWTRRNSHIEPVFVKSQLSACGVTNAYEKPAQLGVDRWLAMIAAHQQYSGLLCVVDSGTALTMDFLTASGQHLGGFIVPGADLMKRSLLQNTQKIQLAADAQIKLLGKNTTEAVLLGIEQMLQAFVCQKVAEVELECKQELTLVLTGGHAHSLRRGLQRPCHEEPELVFLGLRLVVEDAE
ncbi:type III pantothenate kinase [Cycloclasticus sp. 46_120_T64]|nr:type III pantothenate kinase [Cycloclasticus sp. 46_120_T64]